MRSNIFYSLSKISDEKYVFWATLIAFILLLTVNVPNKLIAISFIFIFFAFYLKIKKFGQSLLLTYISSLIVFTGKTYPILLLPAGFFPVEIYPQGYIVNIIITSTHFITFVMLLAIIREYFLSKKNSFKFKVTDILILSFYILKIASAFIGSKNPGLSLPADLLSLSPLIAYFYVRVYVNIDSSLWKNVSHLLSALVIFEVLLGFTQLAIKSPLDKYLEYETNIGYFGHTVDETLFTFRPIGTFSHANVTGIWIASVCIFLFSFVLKQKSKLIDYAFYSGILLMIASISRSAWIGFLVGIAMTIIYTFKKYRRLYGSIMSYFIKWRFVIIPVVIAFLLIFIIPRINSSVYSFQEDAGAVFFRKIQILDAIEVIKLNPIFGVGSLMSVYEGISLDLYTKAASLPLDVHMWYLALAVNNGLVSLFVFVFFIGLSLKKILDSKKINLILISVVSTILCIASIGILQPYINIEFVLLLLSFSNSDIIKTENVK